MDSASPVARYRSFDNGGAIFQEGRCFGTEPYPVRRPVLEGEPSPARALRPSTGSVVRGPLAAQASPDRPADSFPPRVLRTHPPERGDSARPAFGRPCSSWTPKRRPNPCVTDVGQGVGRVRALPGPTDRSPSDLAGPTGGQPCVTDVGQDKRARS
jgi:hypothetical protein